MKINFKLALAVRLLFGAMLACEFGGLVGSTATVTPAPVAATARACCAS